MRTRNRSPTVRGSSSADESARTELGVWHTFLFPTWPAGNTTGTIPLSDRASLAASWLFLRQSAPGYRNPAVANVVAPGPASETYLQIQNMGFIEWWLITYNSEGQAVKEGTKPIRATCMECGLTYAARREKNGTIHIVSGSSECTCGGTMFRELTF